MAEKKPQIIETAAIAWRDAFRAIELMPAVVGIAFALYLAMSFGLSAINTGPDPVTGGPWLPIISIGASIVQAVLLAPLAIAVHRLVLLGETTSRYPLEPNSSRYLRFVGFAILVKFLWLIPSTFESLLPVVSFIASVLFITALIMVVRRAILFPAIAIDAPGATWSNARLDTKGSSWRVAFIFVLTGLPVLVIRVPLAWLWLLAAPQPKSSLGSFLFFYVIDAVIAIAALCAYAAAASHIYQTRADAMTQPRATP
jgi:hypothetical protein